MHDSNVVAICREINLHLFFTDISYYSRLCSVDYDITIHSMDQSYIQLLRK